MEQVDLHASVRMVMCASMHARTHTHTHTHARTHEHTHARTQYRARILIMIRWPTYVCVYGMQVLSNLPIIHVIYYNNYANPINYIISEGLTLLIERNSLNSLCLPCAPPPHPHPPLPQSTLPLCDSVGSVRAVIRRAASAWQTAIACPQVATDGRQVATDDRQTAICRQCPAGHVQCTLPNIARFLVSHEKNSRYAADHLAIIHTTSQICIFSDLHCIGYLSFIYHQMLTGSLLLKCKIPLAYN